MFKESWQRFAIVSFLYLVALFTVFQYNIPIFRAINGFYTDLFQYPMLFLTAMADGLIVFIIATLFFKKRNEKHARFILSLLATALLVNTIKYYFPALRPPKLLQGESLFIIGDVFSNRSFPSGHAAAIMVLARFLTFRQPWYISIPVIFTCILAAISRVYVGVHFPLDILVGGGIGFFLGDFIFRSGTKYKISNYPAIQRWQTLITYPAAILIGVYFIISESKSYEPIDLTLNITVILTAIYFAFRFAQILKTK
ncbi:MAG: phosphatase PAP2 family protein [Leptospirales bacterium]